jgi:hypothetical protein
MSPIVVNKYIVLVLYFTAKKLVHMFTFINKKKYSHILFCTAYFKINFNAKWISFCSESFNDVVKKSGYVTMMVNNAGIIDEHNIERCIAVNMVSVILIEPTFRILDDVFFEERLF